MNLYIHNFQSWLERSFQNYKFYTFDVECLSMNKTHISDKDVQNNIYLTRDTTFNKRNAQFVT